MKIPIAGVFIAHLFAFFLSGSEAVAQHRSIQTREVRGESLDVTNLICEDPAKTAAQRAEARSQFDQRLNMRNGICAWHSGEYYSTEPQEQIRNLGSEGCRVVITALGTCYQ
jgi:hypothetical protein